jgi:hypothetical protein
MFALFDRSPGQLFGIIGPTAGQFLQKAKKYLGVLSSVLQVIYTLPNKTQARIGY